MHDRTTLPRTFYAQPRGVTPDGYLELASGQRLRLAGICMRSVDETQEPGLLDVVNEIIVRESDWVRVERDSKTDSAVVHYKQRIYYFPEYWLPLMWTKRLLKPRTSGTVNELLIIMAAARYDPTVGNMREKARRKCEVAAERAERALWEKHRYRRLVEYKSDSGQIYTNHDGYRARIAKGDLAQRDENLARAYRQ